MAFISFGKEEIEELNIENERLENELAELEIVCSNLKEQIEEKNIKLVNHKNYIKQIKGIIEKYEKLLSDNRDLNAILNNPERSSKATITNLKFINELKNKGYSYREISKQIHVATGEELSYSTVRYLYKKYIESDEQWS